MSVEKWTSCLVAVAALAGAAGVAEAAYAAHGSADPLLQTASNFLLIHAGAVIAIASFANSLPQRSKSVLLAATLLLLGTVIFCGDLSVRVISGQRLFPMAAPLGGSLMILGWLATAIAAFFGLRKKAL